MHQVIDVVHHLSAFRGLEQGEGGRESETSARLVMPVKFFNRVGGGDGGG